MWSPDLDVCDTYRVRPKLTYDLSATPSLGELARPTEVRPLAKGDLEALRAAVSEHPYGAGPQGFG